MRWMRASNARPYSEVNKCRRIICRGDYQSPERMHLKGSCHPELVEGSPQSIGEPIGGVPSHIMGDVSTSFTSFIPLNMTVEFRCVAAE